MSLRILILTNRVPYPLHDGGAMAMDAMIRGYHEAGLQVYVLAMNTSRHEVSPDILQNLYPGISGFHWVPVNNEVTTLGVAKNLLLSRVPEHVRRFENAAFRKTLLRLLEEIHPDIVQLESPFLGSYIAPVRQYDPSIRLVYRMHNVEAQIWQRLADKTPGLKRAYLRVLAKRISHYERDLWRDVDLLLPITASDALTVKEAGIQTALEVAPFGINISGLQQVFPAGPMKAYHIGAMDWLPNAEAMQWFLAEAWPGVHELSPKLGFYFAGRHMPDSFYKNLPAGAFCEGAVPDATAFIKDKHLLVVPLRSGGGIRVKILEAMSQGKLVISSDIGMQGIEAQEDIHYLRANTAQEFIYMIGWAGDHPEKAAAAARAGQRLIRERYDIRSITAGVVSRLQEMIANSGSTSSRSK